MAGNCPCVVHIVHKGTGLAVDLHNDNKHLVLKPIDSNSSQHWIAQETEWGTYTFINKQNGKVLDCKRHAKVEPVNHSSSQQWLCNCSGVLKNFKYDVVLSAKRKNVVIRPVKYTLNEQFQLQVCDAKV